MLARYRNYDPLFVCLVCLSQVGVLSKRLHGRIEVVFGMEASFDISYMYVVL